MSSGIRIKQTTTPSTPATGYMEFYLDQVDKHVKVKDDTGAVFDLQNAPASISGLTGDVTATGPGVVAATVAQVGGVVAANVASGANLANAYLSTTTSDVQNQINLRELLSNKTTNFNTLNDTLYPTVLAVQNKILEALTGLQSYFLYNLASDIPTYLQMKTNASTGGDQTLTTGGVIDQQLLYAFATNTGFPNSTFLPSGILKFHIHALQTAGSAATQLFARIYKRAVGGTETLLATTSITGTLTGVQQEFQVDTTLSAGVTLLTSDRLVMKVYAAVGGGSAPTVQLVIEGTTASRLELPIPALSVGDLTTSTTGVSIGGGTAAVVGTGTTIDIQTASGSQPGLLSAANWTTFNSKADPMSVAAVAGDITLTTNRIHLVSTAAARNLTLPAHVAGQRLIIKDSTGNCETNNITLIRTGGGNIDGIAASRVLQANWGAWELVDDGTDWFII